MRIDEIINLEVLNLNTNKLFERLPNYKEPFAPSTSDGKDRPGDDQVTIFIGKNAKGYDMKAQQMAQYMEKLRYSRDDIWKKTGMHRNQNGDWRMEISDRELKIRQREFKDKEKYKFNDVFDHKKLYDAYPFLKDYTIIIDSDLDAHGTWHATKKEMRIHPDSLTRLVAVHELQHAVQNVEKPEDKNYEGTKQAIMKAIPGMSALDVYLSYHNEMEAYSAEERLDFDDWKRQQNIPTNTTSKYVTIQNRKLTGPGHPLEINPIGGEYAKYQGKWNPVKVVPNAFYGLSPDQWDDADPMQQKYNSHIRGNPGGKNMEYGDNNPGPNFKHSHTHQQTPKVEPKAQTPTVPKPKLRPNQQTPTVSKPKLRPTNLGKQNKIDQKSGAGTYNYEN